MYFFLEICIFSPTVPNDRQREEFKYLKLERLKKNSQSFKKLQISSAN